MMMAPSPTIASACWLCLCELNGLSLIETVSVVLCYA